jgi:hypothetical protein
MEIVMTKTGRLQFLVLMIPTIVVLVAAGVSMVDLEIPSDPTYAMATAYAAVAN